MSRRGERRRKVRAPARAGARRRSAALRRWLPWAAVALVALVALGWWAQRRMVRARPRPAAAALPDSIRALSPEAAYARASALIRTRPGDALLYCRRAQDDPGLELLVRLATATAYQNMAALSVVRRGLPGPALRSSTERVALLVESLRQLGRAAALAQTPQQAAEVHATYARVYLTWGLPWDALDQMRAAGRADPAGWQPIAEEAALWLEEPTRYSPETTQPRTDAGAGTEVPTPVPETEPSAGR